MTGSPRLFEPGEVYLAFLTPVLLRLVLCPCGGVALARSSGGMFPYISVSLSARGLPRRESLRFVKKSVRKAG